jgi:drug/metabolite transporter (DMT)-like permease
MNLYGETSGLAALLAVGSAFAWGSSDFSGGLASKRSSPLSVMLVSTPLGLVFLVSLALVHQAPMVNLHDALLALAAGLCGAVGTLALYRALSKGKMGIAAPLAAVVANLVAVLFGSLTEGVPSVLQGFGFLLAILGVWIISRPNGDSSKGSLRDLLPATIAGVGFGLFFSVSAQYIADDVSWAVGVARLSAAVVITLAALVSKPSLQLGSGEWMLVLLVAVMDSLGNVAYALAAQVGRLDVSVVLSNLYPVATVGLAMLVLRERLTRVQGVGVIVALASIPLIVG